ncbi:response regulator transcription factor [Vibrio campbellii]|uniref:response regulator transcription factor n=1 Tax=Vibrio campbellii TaxID=680 RepID=UPI001F07F00D|nr:response regulator transcription factor [Vibrio campbellii]UMM05284.1 response regulator transcription factor [Vibrio campbellii]
MKTSYSLQILFVEDNIELAQTTVEHFELEGICCDHALNGLAALELVKQTQYHVIVLNINLPKMSGLEFSRVLREQGNDVPIIMLTAKDKLEDKLVGFESGADDYMTKPFAFEELLMRVKVLSRRRSGEVSIFKLGELTVNLTEKTVCRNDDVIKVSPTGFSILEVLLRSSPKPVSREYIIQTVWGDAQPETNSLKVHMFKLRSALDGNYEKKLIHTIKGVGFSLNEET